eukprot:CAMPEP_0114512844 /NCGR_PEP_ID=MMETSP0109-20121206/15215_1 /TAXON_ID=29199 /ORGANISM="Chlorarachnion reptans, Strain CCCM449" /LENGTH=192 /DNA_ID=CAMNT_0001692601 /DNA_START=261 /DNA_END=839 /DNA_ORIENTATION=-
MSNSGNLTFLPLTPRLPPLRFGFCCFFCPDFFAGFRASASVLSADEPGREMLLGGLMNEDPLPEPASLSALTEECASATIRSRRRTRGNVRFGHGRFGPGVGIIRLSSIVFGKDGDVLRLSSIVFEKYDVQVKSIVGSARGRLEPNVEFKSFVMFDDEELPFSSEPVFDELAPKSSNAASPSLCSKIDIRAK